TEEQGLNAGIISALINIGNVYHQGANYSKALEYYFNALKNAEETNSKSDIAICFSNIGLMYLKMNRVKDAEKYTLKALAIASTIDDMDFLNNVYLQLSDVYYETGKYAIAFENYRKHVEIKDTLVRRQNAKK